MVVIQKKLGDTCRQLEDFAAAEGWYSAGINGSKKIKNREWAETLAEDARAGLALAKRGRGQYSAALQLLNRSRRLFQARGDQQGLAYVLWAIGTTSRFAGRLKEAEKNLRKSLALYTRLEDEGGKAYANCGLGGTLRIQGRAQESSRHYRRSLKIFKTLDDYFGVAYSLCGIGNSFRMQNRVKESVPFFKKAIRIYRSIGQKGPLAYVQWNLSQSFLALGLYAQAFLLLKKARKLFAEVQDWRGLLYVMLGFGELIKKSKPNQSLTYFSKAAKKAKTLKLHLEFLYAVRHLQNKTFEAQFKKLGVDWPRFKKYHSIP